MLRAGGWAPVLLLRAGGRTADGLCGGRNRTRGPIRCLNGNRPDRLNGLDRLDRLDRLGCLNRLNRLYCICGYFLWRSDSGSRLLC